MRRRKASELETSTTVMDEVLQDPLGAAFAWIVVCLMAVGFLFADNGMHWSLPFAVLAGIPLGTIVWWFLVFSNARGWSDGDA